MPDAFIAGRHEAQIKLLSDDMALVKEDVRWIRETLAEKRGERRVSLYFAATGGGLAASVIGLLIRRALHLP